MAENRKYYWLKLQKDFFKRADIRIVEAMPNGKDYILFYLKMLVESVSHEGNLRFSDTIPYNDDMLSVITNTNVDIVRSAMKIFKELKMIEVMDDSTIYMNEVNKMVGVASSSEHDRLMNTERQRRFRERKKQAKLLGNDDSNVTVTLHSNAEIEKDIELESELDKEIETDKEIDKETDKKRGKPRKVFFPNDELLDDAFRDFVDMRKKMRKPMTDRAISLSIKELEKLSKDMFGNMDNNKAIEIINQTIKKGWLTFYPLKEEKQISKPSGGIDWNNV